MGPTRDPGTAFEIAHFLRTLDASLHVPKASSTIGNPQKIIPERHVFLDIRKQPSATLVISWYPFWNTILHCKPYKVRSAT